MKATVLVKLLGFTFLQNEDKENKVNANYCTKNYFIDGAVAITLWNPFSQCIHFFHFFISILSSLSVILISLVIHISFFKNIDQ